jgi:gamma-glutamyltranspeptidase/glutathione hydrolase
MRNAKILAAWTLLAASGVRAEVTATHGMVVTTTGTGAAAAGIETLRSGGNAMDAAMTAVLLQPCLAAGSYVSYAGIINVVYFDATSGKVSNLNGGFNTVLGETDPLTIPGINTATLAASKLESFESAPSGRTALVPGFFAGVEAAQRRFGKRRFSDVIAPAIRCAEQGFVLSPELAGVMKMREAVLRRLPETRAIFTKNGALYAAGETFRQPALAATLRTVAIRGATPYLYRGEWAKALVEAVQRDGGKMARVDLEAYQPTWIEPVHTRFNGFDVYAQGLPSMGGVNLVQGLNLATAAGLPAQPPYRESPLTFFWQLQFAKVGNLLAAPGVAPQFEKALGFDLSPAARLKPETAEKLWKLLAAGQMPSVPAPRTPRTAHSDAVVAVDAAGNMAAVVHTINTVNWGSTGIFVGGISIPDSAAFQQPAIAALAPGSRLPDFTNPGVALRDGKPVLSFSSIGTGVDVRTLGALMDVLGHGMTPEQAIASPAHGGFDYSKAASGEIGAMVGVGELSAEYLEQLRALGQPVREDDTQRGFWIGIGVGDGESRLRGGGLRELAMGGGAVGY